VFVWAAALAAVAAPLRVAVLDFADRTGQKSDEKLGGAIAPGAMADKGVFLLGKQLAGNPGFVLIDRRDLIAQMEKLRPQDMGRLTPTQPSFLHAAQLLRADAVLRGSLLSLSSSKQKINLGGNASEHNTLTVRAGIEALDAKDGSIIAVADGKGERVIRQTDAVQTEMSEDDVIGLVEEALQSALPAVAQALGARTQEQLARPTVKVAVATDADPALVEVDGVLVGTTPLENFEVYKGDHVMTVGRPGYQDITKRILFEKDTRITVPMFKTELSADQLKEVLEKARLNGFFGNVEPGLIIQTIDERGK
jgi:hypothetical protein